MARAVAVLLSVWAGLRWAGLVAGLVRMRRFEGAVRREARRACGTRAALNVFVSVAATYAWAAVLRLRPSDSLVGTFAMALVVAMVAAVVLAFRQPAQRSPETFELFRLRPRRPPP